MQTLTRIAMLMCLLAPGLSNAASVWTACGTITSVSNYAAGNGQFYVTLSSGSFPSGSTCAPLITGTLAIEFAPGQQGVTSSNINSLLATALEAYASGQNVMIYYDNSTNYCYGQVIALGGYSAQC